MPWPISTTISRRWTRPSRSDDDRSMALSALIEGEATLAMIGAEHGRLGWHRGHQAARREPRLDLQPDVAVHALHGRRQDPAAVPPIISESMLFPYMKGVVFCAKLTNDGGWKAIDDAYRNLPQSTEQILHPEKFRTNPDRPMTIDLGPLKPGEGWKELGRNVLGEMQLAVLLRKHGGKPAAAGWDGDRYAVFEGPKDRLGLVWLTTWDSEDDAREFTSAYVKYQTSKLADLPKPRRDDPGHALAKRRRPALRRPAPGPGCRRDRGLPGRAHRLTARVRLPGQEGRDEAGSPARRRRMNPRKYPVTSAG